MLWLLRLEVVNAYSVHVYRFSLQGDDLFVASKFFFCCLIQVIYHCIEEFTEGKREHNNALHWLMKLLFLM